MSVACIVFIIFMVNYSDGYSYFTDIQSHWAKQEIQSAVQRGIISGYPDGTFRPDVAVTRSEFAKMLNQGMNLMQTEEIVFSDVQIYQWDYAEISKAFAAGYMQGYADNTFRGKSHISRQEAAKIFYAISPEIYEGELAFVDRDHIQFWAKDSVGYVASKGYIRGNEEKRFRPEEALTRGEACVALMRFLDGEKIYAYSQNIDEQKDIRFKSIYTSDIVVEKESQDEEIRFKQIVSLGDIYIETDERCDIVFEQGKIQRVWLNDRSGESRIRLVGNTTIEQVIAPYGGWIDVDTTAGDSINKVTVKGKKSEKEPLHISGYVNKVSIEDTGEIRLEKGRIEKLVVYNKGKGATVFQETGTLIEEAVVDSPIEFQGLGRVVKLQAQSNGITYQTEPLGIFMSPGVRRPPKISDQEGLKIPAFTPSHSEDSVDIGTEIWIDFDEPIFRYDGQQIYNEDIEDIIEIRQSHVKGRKINYTGTIQPDGKSIKLIPDMPLRKDETYYIILMEEAVENQGGEENEKIVSRFKTGEEKEKKWNIDFYPEQDEKKVSLYVNIEIDFNELIFREDGKALREATLDELIEIRQESMTGKKIEFEGYLEKNGEQIVLEPIHRLERNTYYYVIIKDECLEDEDGNILRRQWIKFKTKL